jgi:uncharacterized protein YegL
MTATNIAPPEMGELVLKRPLKNRELIVLVVDLSGSMTERYGKSQTVKYVDVESHLSDPAEGLVARFQASALHEMWHLAVVTYDTRARSRQPKPLDDVLPADLHLDISVHGGKTAIGGALREAERVIDAWLGESDVLPRKATVLLFTDGLENENSDPIGVAAALKAKNILMVTAVYGDVGDDGEKTLTAMASLDPGGNPYFARVEKGAELRDFFEHSVTRSI